MSQPSHPQQRSPRETPTLPRVILKPGQIGAIDLDPAAVAALAAQTAPLSAAIPWVALLPRDRQQLFGVLFPGCDSFVWETAAALASPCFADAAAAAALTRRQGRATAWSMLARRFADLSIICNDLWLQDQAEGVGAAMTLVSAVHAQALAPDHSALDVSREQRLHAARAHLSRRSPRAEPEASDAKSGERARRKRKKAAERARIAQQRAADDLIDFFTSGGDSAPAVRHTFNDRTATLPTEVPMADGSVDILGIIDQPRAPNFDDSTLPDGPTLTQAAVDLNTAYEDMRLLDPDADAPPAPSPSDPLEQELNAEVAALCLQVPELETYLQMTPGTFQGVLAVDQQLHLAEGENQRLCDDVGTALTVVAGHATGSCDLILNAGEALQHNPDTAPEVAQRIALQLFPTTDDLEQGQRQLKGRRDRQKRREQLQQAQTDAAKSRVDQTAKLSALHGEALPTAAQLPATPGRRKGSTVH